MDESPAAFPPLETPGSAAPLPPPAPSALARLSSPIALLQVFLVSGIPTQLAVALAVSVAGLPLLSGDEFSLEFVAVVSFVDTALIAVLVKLFLTASGENPSDVLLGSRPPGREIWIGLALVPVVLLGVGAIVLTLRTLVPLLHTVTESPLEAFMRTPLDAAIFLVVAVVAGGMREELQRAFILHRFEQRLGGIRIGLVLFSLFFGALHYNQGLDVAIGIGLLGLFWGLIYVRRRSFVAPLVNHAGFNAAQVAQVLVARAVGL